MYKRANICVLLLLIVPVILVGQTNNFEFVQYDTAYVGAEEFVELHGDIFSLATLNQSITVTRVEHQKPSSWVTSFCVGPACLPDFLDTFTFTLFAADTALFSLDTYPHGELGIGSWTIFAVDSSTMEIDSVHITMEVVAVSVDEKLIAPKTFDLSLIYPNPTNAWVNFDLDVEHAGNYSIILFALDGRELISRNYSLRSGKNQLQWGVGALPSGNYIISATSESQTLSRQVSVIK